VPAAASAGLLIYRRRPGSAEVLLVHPGGPFWAGKDQHAWSIPKGLIEPGEDPLAAARREVEEETGLGPGGDDAAFIALPPRRQPGGKTIIAFALEAECDAGAIRSNAFSIEWPPRSGRRQFFPEVDRAQWFALAEARGKLHRGQVGFIDDLAEMLSTDAAAVPDIKP
jgi:predicted NUDIX family NTP pyrophosphohydrolase